MSPHNFECGAKVKPIRSFSPTMFRKNERAAGARFFAVDACLPLKKGCDSRGNKFRHHGCTVPTDYDYFVVFYAPKARKNFTDILSLSVLLTCTSGRGPELLSLHLDRQMKAPGLVAGHGDCWIKTSKPHMKATRPPRNPLDHLTYNCRRKSS